MAAVSQAALLAELRFGTTVSENNSDESTIENKSGWSTIPIYDLKKYR